MKITTPLLKSGIALLVAGYAGQGLGKFCAKPEKPKFNWYDFGIVTLSGLAMMISPFPISLMHKVGLEIGLNILVGYWGNKDKKDDKDNKDDKGKKDDKDGTPNQSVISPASAPVQSPVVQTVKLPAPAPTQQPATVSAPVPVVQNEQSLENTLNSQFPLSLREEELKDLTDDKKKNYDKFIKDMSITDAKMFFDHTDLAKFATKYYQIHSGLTNLANGENEWRGNHINPQKTFHTETKKFIQDAIKIATNNTYQKDTLEEAKKILEGCYQSYLKSLKDDEKFNLSAKCTSLLENQKFIEFTDFLNQILKNQLTVYHAEKFSQSFKK